MSSTNPIELAAEMVAAFVSNNPLPKGKLQATDRCDSRHFGKARNWAGKCAASNRGERARRAHP